MCQGASARRRLRIYQDGSSRPPGLASVPGPAFGREPGPLSDICVSCGQKPRNWPHTRLPLRGQAYHGGMRLTIAEAGAPKRDAKRRVRKQIDGNAAQLAELRGRDESIER